jgi:N6-adenosine-specific RNA methylase IME4
MKKYQIIYADPPWDFGGGGVYQDGGRARRATADQYPLMKFKDLVMLPIRQITDEDCLLFLWTTDQHLPDALTLLNSWGFQYCTVAFYWVKKYHTGSTCFNVGCWTMKSVEQVLLGTRGKPLKFKKERNIKQLVEEERTTHSRKPDEVRKRIVSLVGDRPRVELFAREKTGGWDVWGNEIEPTAFLILGNEVVWL